jgi:hypothetical protein
MFGQKRSSYLVLAAKRLSDMEKAAATLRQNSKGAGVSRQVKKFMTELGRHRRQFERTTRQMNNHITAAEVRLRRLNVASTASWAAFQAALVKSQKAFARANRKAGKAIKRAVN